MTDVLQYNHTLNKRVHIKTKITRSAYTMTKLTPEQTYKVNQVIANLQIEDMNITEQAHKNLVELASGKKTTKQIIQEIQRRYTHA